MTILLDADSIIYGTCFALESEDEQLSFLQDAGDPTYSISEDELYKMLDKSINDVKEAFEIELALTGHNAPVSVEVHLTCGQGKFKCKHGVENFRYANPLGYKQNRKNMRTPAGFDEAWIYLVNQHNAQLAVGMEADDVVVYKKTAFPDDYMIAAIDKDILKQCEGKHYDFRKQLWVTTTAEEALWYKYYQCICGDSIDGYKGIPRYGDAKACKLLGQPGDLSEKEMWEVVVKTGRRAGVDKDYLINTMRLCCMHQFNGKEIKLWEEPK